MCRIRKEAATTSRHTAAERLANVLHAANWIAKRASFPRILSRDGENNGAHTTRGRYANDNVLACTSITRSQWQYPQPVRTVAFVMPFRVCVNCRVADICVRIAYRVVTIYKMKLQRHVQWNVHTCMRKPFPHPRKIRI